MKSQRVLLMASVVLLTLVLTTNSAGAQGPKGAQPRAPRAALGTAFTYQGQLKSGGSAYTGACDMQFALFNAASSGTQIGTTQSVSGVTVTNGLFTTPIDFGASAFDGNQRFLQIAVKCGSDASYTPLAPLQELTPAPMALALPGLYTQQNATSPNLIGGYSGNGVTSGVVGATIGGGGDSTHLNRVTDNFGTVGGGYGNQAGDNAGTTSDSTYATVGGGFANTASGDQATVGGGSSNYASGSGATVGGGNANHASNTWSTVGGGNENIASGSYSTVPGGFSNTASGSKSFAAGYRAQANADGNFTFADSNNFDFTSTTANSFRVRSTGGVRFVLGIDGTGATTWSCSVFDGGSWSCSSDRNLKENFVAVDNRTTLARLSQVPILQWNAKGTDPHIKHFGPMAQDFYAAFGLGDDDKSINTIDLDGVALSSIQGLYEMAQQKDAQIAAQQKEIDDLESRLAALEQSTVAAKSPPNDFASSGWVIGTLLGAVVLVGTRRWGGTR